jgi:nitronate monooxygenase
LLDRFGLRVPIFQAGFGSVTNVALAAAVSNAGAMGALGTLNAQNVKDRVAELRAATKGPFFVNIILQVFVTNPPDILPIVLDAGAPLVQFSWGIPAAQGVAMIRAARAQFGVQVTSRESARAALDAGADFLICQGTEADGHVQAHRGVYEALPEVLAEAKETPVIAAGGIGNGMGIYKALRAGASAVLLGTRFVATTESNAHEEYKKSLLGAKVADTALTMCFQDGWPQLHRALRNATFRAWEAAGCPRPGKPGRGRGDVQARGWIADSAVLQQSTTGGVHGRRNWEGCTLCRDRGQRGEGSAGSWRTGEAALGGNSGGASGLNVRWVLSRSVLPIQPGPFKSRKLAEH